VKSSYVFLPDAAELERLRAFAEKVAASENDTAGTRAMARYALTGSLEGVVDEMRAALQPEGSAGTREPDPERPPDLYAAVQVVRAFLGIATPDQIIQEEANRLAGLRAAEGSARDGG
jgi:hypothetical protein